MDFITIVNTAHAVFKYVDFYVRGGQGILVMTNDAASAHPNPAAEDVLARGLQAAHATATVPGLQASLVANAAAVDQMLTRRLGPGGERLYLSTDNNLYLEYATPKGNAVITDTTRQILGLFTPPPADVQQAAGK
jgi:spermidine synthase